VAKQQTERLTVHAPPQQLVLEVHGAPSPVQLPPLVPLVVVVGGAQIIPEVKLWQVRLPQHSVDEAHGVP
jgi:hypothetical protein